MAEMAQIHWDETVDLLVIGGGAAGMTAALVGSLEGPEATQDFGWNSPSAGLLPALQVAAFFNFHSYLWLIV